MTFAEGSRRTILCLRLASFIALARLAGLRYLSSFTVSTPAACSSPEYSLLMPLMRMRSATLAQHRSCFSSKPVFMARTLRAFTVLAASKRLSVERILTVLRIATTSASIPSISVSGYDIKWLRACDACVAPLIFRLDELTQPGDSTDDLADRVLSGLFAGKGDGFLSDGLHLAHAQPSRHHLGAGAHDAAHAKTPTAVVLLSLDKRFRARQPADEGLDLFCRTFLLQEVEDDADSLLGGGLVNAKLGDKTRDQFIHVPLAAPRCGELPSY